MKLINTLALIGVSVSFIGCQSLSGGIPGLSAYLQFVRNETVFYEYAVPVDGMPCSQNAAENNREITDTQAGQYRCTNFPASANALPFSFIAVHLNPDYPSRASAAATTRFASSESCWAAVVGLKENNRRLVAENCGPKPTPDRVGGDKLA